MRHIHVIGAGLAGLAAAVALARTGESVTLHEAAGRAGGRCRSYVDTRLGCLVDNGNHLLLSGNHAALEYLEDIGARPRLVGPDTARFAFFDLRSGRRWCLEPGAGRLPWWLLRADRRIPDTRVRSYLTAVKLVRAGPDRTVTDCVGDRGALFERFWEPLSVSVLNTPPRVGAACLLWAALRETFAKGEAACRPLTARIGLSHAFVDPALALLRERGAVIRFGARLRRIVYAGREASRLEFGERSSVALGPGDRVVLAVPPAAAASLLPFLTVPEESNTIVNGHFRLSAPPARLPAEAPFLGLVGGTAQWIFVRGDVVSTTVSAADELADEPPERIARRIWQDVAAALGLDREPLPVSRIIKERRATFAQTPAQVRRRPATHCGLGNVFLAGDWIDTGLPATIEGAIRSGRLAAVAAVGR